EGKLLADEEMILTRAQIAIGLDYIAKFEGSSWGYPGATKLEPGVSSTYRGVPAGAIDRAKKVRDLEAKLKPQYLVSLVRAVLLEGYSAETWAGATGRHPKSGIELFRVCLDMMGAE